MDKAYDHKKYEEEIYKKWEESGAFKPSGLGKPFTVLMPPPNANASLHAGHAMYTIDDIVVRWKRMQGFSAVWIPGTDHAGFETQFVYEKYLAKQGKSRMDFDRQTLYKNIFDFVKGNSGLIFSQFKRLGFSADWERAVFTLDQPVLDRVFETFKKMESEGLVYRAEYMVNYCVHCGTSLAELEVEHEERIDPLYYIDYPLLEEQGKKITVATVRPETIFGDTAVAVNPKDKRYKDLVGKKLCLPLTQRMIEVIADERADRDFGTGAVKITPAHDSNDFETGKRHHLEVISVIDLAGRMKLPADVNFKEIEGVKVKEARERTVEKLIEEGFLKEEKIDKNYSHAVTVCYRCKRDMEPAVIPNWFIKVEEFKKPAIEATRKDKVKFWPSKFKNQMLQWLTIMHDWPISRQIVWGIRIPVWYEIEPGASNIWVWWLDKEGKLQQNNVKYFLENGTLLPEIETGLQRVQAMTGKSAPRYVIAKEKPGDNYLPETDTFDTWFSSGQWPLVTLKESEMGNRLPTNFMGTLADILTFWISRMMMFSLYVNGKVPFENVYLWSMVADSKGVKMSKSKGNVINPIDFVDKYGADALRMSLVFGVAPESKIPLAEEKVKGMRNFSNKIWNMGRLIKIMYEEYGKEVLPYSDQLLPALQPEDKEIIKKMETMVKVVNKSLNKFRFSDAAEAIYCFMWHELADVYLEQIKTRRQDEVALAVAREAYIKGLKLLHPFMPFVTEAVWQELKFGVSPILLLTKWPEA